MTGIINIFDHCAVLTKNFLNGDTVHLAMKFSGQILFSRNCR